MNDKSKVCVDNGLFIDTSHHKTQPSVTFLILYSLFMLFHEKRGGFQTHLLLIKQVTMFHNFSNGCSCSQFSFLLSLIHIAWFGNERMCTLAAMTVAKWTASSNNASGELRSPPLTFAGQG